ncbi:trafficking protein particle complex subunit 12-like [Mangifera indica]|uniref:trafficking protein particle complex subunit 12-like n=1 Tax=Mangifera indica TaxID=29780 RepID=UPI001CFAD209|nr:trafficking protein particle complex subunit 12-like [Mangifera indica]
MEDSDQTQTPTRVTDPLTNAFGSLNDLAPELSSLQDLATRGSWRSILDKVSRARSFSLLTLPHHHLTYLSYNALALMKLRRFDDAAQELDSLEDFNSSSYQYESYPHAYPNRSGSMVPFSLRWLHAVLLLKMSNRQEGLDRLYLLLDFIREKLRQKIDEKLDLSASMWRKREVIVVNCLIGYHLSGKEFGVCLNLIRELLKDSADFDPVLVSKLGYIQMQIGDLEGATTSFNRVEEMLKSKKSDDGDGDGDGDVELRNLVNRNKVLVYLIGKDYVSAVREYEECIERNDSDVVAVNNKALCLMYLRDLSDGIKVLENALERVPTVALNETVVVNLCSMYELAYVNHSDIKRTLSNWIARVAPDDFDSSCTRI